MKGGAPGAQPVAALPAPFGDALARPSAVALFVDFDGTLAPIVDDPDLARPSSRSIELLATLADAIGTVAVVSGRPISFLEGQLPASVAIAGLYGLETLRDGTRTDADQGGCWREVIADLAAHATAAGPEGMRVEGKELSITLHYREHPDLADEVGRWAAAEAKRSGLDARPARQSWELHPPLPVDKGTAVLDLAADAQAVCFIGDDHGDLPAFASLDQIAADGGVALRVAVQSDEMDPDLMAAADLVVDGPVGVEALLADMVAHLPDA